MGVRAHGQHLESAAPGMPLEDRAADTWEPLIAVADLAGGPWPGRARAAALALTEAKEATSDQPLRTEDLLDRLKDDPEALWSTLAGRADGLTAMKLGALLRVSGTQGTPSRRRPEPAPRA
ncbi:MAG TPA: DUF3631 domain-containing protein [Kineosporiaceae bacterium]|nr:DUF3631 domain-containing protein [Kineosporiaceae bacterium]